jgi:hypothetical protein
VDLTIAVGADLVTAFQSGRVELLVGEGEHAGRMRIVNVDEGGYALLKRAPKGTGEIGAIIRRRMPKTWPHEKQRPAIVKHELVEGGIEIELPEWASASKTAAAATPPPAPSPPRADLPLQSPGPSAGAPKESAAAAPPRRMGAPGLPADEAARRETALVKAISECYEAGIRPSFADLARSAQIPQGSLPELLNRMAEAGRFTRDEHGYRPRGKPPLALGKRTLPSNIAASPSQMTARR